MVKNKISGKFFAFVGCDLEITFFILPTLQSFDGIIGDDTLKDLRAIINRDKDELIINSRIKIPLKNKTSEVVNSLTIVNKSVPESSKLKLESICTKFEGLFGPVNNEKIRTNVKAEIRTRVDEPIYTKSYPYPAGMREEVERQVNELLAEKIIRPSKSPYNSPIWVVPKKDKPNGEKQYRMVIDFKRLNAVTISDTYPIPDINNTLASLGDAKFFTTLDLTSGFHQISMYEKDIPKTAFSTMNGKFEFLRLPFGLKNAPAIFQRMIDDVLKELIGKICYVYIDDIIIYSKTIEDHLKDVETIFSKLHEAGLKVNLEKTHFLNTSVEFLGFLVTSDGILPNPHKVRAIEAILPPSTLKELKSFLGLTSYYRRFIQDYAKIAKPLTNMTRGELSQVRANQSKKVAIELNDEGLKAFQTLKKLLTSAEVLAFPDFDKPFNLTTDASDYAIGAVLSQGEPGKDRPISFISRSLSRTEEGYATNEKELRAIVWALDNLRNYLYGAKKIRIYTDHQPLTYTLSNKNYNAKLKRWKARIEEYNYELIYTPGKSNFVADALSRLPTQVNNLSSSGSSSSRTKTADIDISTETAYEGRSDVTDNILTATADEGLRELSLSETEESCTMHSANQDSTDLIPHVEVPLNVFRNQLVFRIARLDVCCHEEPHPGFHRYYISSKELDQVRLREALRENLNPNVINGIKIPEEYLWMLQNVYLENFEKYKIRVTQRLVEDVANEERRFSIIENEHRRAHRAPRENKEQILERYYFPQMMANVRKYAASCDVCNRNKYDRHPNNPELQATPVPRYPCEIIHMDIMEIQDEKFITVVDKFSKFSKFFHLKDRSAISIRSKIIKMVHFFTAPLTLVTDNEKGFLSPIVLNLIKNLGIKLYLTPSHRSEVNGQIERVHSTVLEIYRCLREEYKDLSVKELVYVAVDRYNNTIHSVINKKPSDVFFNRSQRINYQSLLNIRQKINNDLRGIIRKNMDARNARKNLKRVVPKKYRKGEVVYVATKGIKSKNKPLYRKEIVAKDNKVTITTESGKKIHKAHLKNIR